VLNLMGTHTLTEWADRREKLAAMRVSPDYSVAENGSKVLSMQCSGAAVLYRILL
jgi:hypothetical protein